MENNQGSITKKIDDEIDYERQIFDELDVNNYEIVVAVAKAARDINVRAQKFLGPEFEVRPTNMALKKLKKDTVKFVYDEEISNSADTTADEG